MTKLASRTIVPALSGALLLIATGVFSVASAQDAILLESIGSVRMLSPDELQRRTTEDNRAADQQSAATMQDHQRS